MSEAESGHEFIDHTGDMALLVRAPSLVQLYDEAVRALFDVIVDLTSIQAGAEVEIDVEGAADAEDLFVRFLSELLFLHDARDWLFRGFRTRTLSAHQVTGAAIGEKFEPQRHAILRQVKAVTYHHQLLEHGGEGWTARVVLDL